MPMQKAGTKTWMNPWDDDDEPLLTGSDRRSPRKSTQVRAFRAGEYPGQYREYSPIYRQCYIQGYFILLMFYS